MGCPALAIQRQHLGRRHVPEPIGQAKALAHAEIVYGQHVGATQLEHQQHLHRPAADTPHRREPLDDFKIAQGVQRIAHRDNAAQGLGG
jgi:hypothetical protein